MKLKKSRKMRSSVTLRTLVLFVSLVVHCPHVHAQPLHFMARQFAMLVLFNTALVVAPPKETGAGDEDSGDGQRRGQKRPRDEEDSDQYFNDGYFEPAAPAAPVAPAAQAPLLARFSPLRTPPSPILAPRSPSPLALPPSTPLALQADCKHTNSSSLGADLATNGSDAFQNLLASSEAVMASTIASSPVARNVTHLRPQCLPAIVIARSLPVGAYAPQASRSSSSFLPWHFLAQPTWTLSNAGRILRAMQTASGWLSVNEVQELAKIDLGIEQLRVILNGLAESKDLQRRLFRRKDGNCYEYSLIRKTF
jgi:hypothetical protein